MPKPPWMNKHTCEICGTGYMECAQGLALNLQCCAGCNHPGRWQPEPYTVEELAEMRERA